MNHTDIFEQVNRKILEYIREDNESSIPVVKFKTPAELKKAINFEVEKQGASEIEFLKMIDKYLEYSVRTGNKQFLNQLYSGFNLPAFIGEVITALTNTSMYTYEVAPVATLIEAEMISLMNRYVGYKNGDGIFLSGGSNGNLIAMFSARNRVLPQSRFEGYDRTNKLVAFVNEYAHYSFETAANILGIGSKNVIKVKADKGGKLIPEELGNEIDNALSRGEKPFFVAATCATTLLGSYDPIDEMAEICKKHDIWLHADGAFGGSILLSDKYRHLLKGIEKTDSFAWDPHKLMNIPLICSALLVRKKGILHSNITDINTDYLYHDSDDIEDLGKKSVQCGRKVDAVKLWFAWKYFGLDGYRKRIDDLIELAAYAEDIVRKNQNLELMIDRQSFAICFRYIPKYKSDLNAINLQLRETLRKSGKTLVNYGYIKKALVIRLVTANGELHKSDIDVFFDLLLNEAEKLEKELIHERR